MKIEEQLILDLTIFVVFDLHPPGFGARCQPPLMHTRLAFMNLNRNDHFPKLQAKPLS
jgi:hypothetical protein